MKRAVVFAYHDVGVRCLQVLLSQNVEVALVVTHQDDPQENIWFDSVAELCRQYGLPCIIPDNPNAPDVVDEIKALAPDFFFSFYCRHILREPLLAIPRQGAFNMHGSLLPKYRGRAPVNWAIIHGETETGATLHVMDAKPDNGAVVDQFAVPILINDTAIDVFRKVTVAAEICLQRALPGVLSGQYPLKPQNLALGAYFGGRNADDGRIQPGLTAPQIHNLVRAVSHPYPGAFIDTPVGRLVIWKTGLADTPPTTRGPGIYRLQHQQHYLIAPAGGCLRLLDFEIDGQANTLPAAAESFNPFGSPS
jgi:methionyl-tRNA formyltransferase